MIKVVIIGSGNVALHLANAFYNSKEVDLVQIYARNIAQLNALKKQVDVTNNIAFLAKAAIYIIAVSDDAIPDVSSLIDAKNGLVVHTSGNISLNSLKNKGRKGIFYPLQSFSKEKSVCFNKIPFCLEAQNKEDFNLLKKLAESIGKEIYEINSEQRKAIHLAAVFVNNFTNHLYKISNDICEKHKIPFKILYPLIDETTSKIKELSPEKAQTGPAIRNDKETIQNHLNILDKEQQDIYQLITKSIQKNGKKL